MEWTDEYCGSSHLGKPNTEGRTWYTVERHGNLNPYAVLLTWYPGCKSRPLEERFPTVAEAKKKAEGGIE